VHPTSLFDRMSLMRRRNHHPTLVAIPLLHSKMFLMAVNGLPALFSCAVVGLTELAVAFVIGMPLAIGGAAVLAHCHLHASSRHTHHTYRFQRVLISADAHLCESEDDQFDALADTNSSSKSRRAIYNTLTLT
jgi:hypothetical protein